MALKIPAPLSAEHHELHEELVRATGAGGRVGQAAKEVATLLHPHFVTEEEIAMPPLALLEALAAGPPTADMGEVLALTDRLRAEMPKMLEEHGRIVAALERLRDAARADGKPEFEHFAAKLRLHAETEEQVLYPAALIVGDLVRAGLRR